MKTLFQLRSSGLQLPLARIRPLRGSHEKTKSKVEPRTTWRHVTLAYILPCSQQMLACRQVILGSDSTLYLFMQDIYYQKIDKYKWKYRGNIFVDKFPRNFTDENIPSVYTDGITVGKNLKQSKKKKMTCHFYQRNYRRNIPLVNCDHCSSCQLQRESPTEFSVGIFQRVLFGGFLKKFN